MRFRDQQTAPFKSFLLVPTRNGIHKGPKFQGRGMPVIKMGEVYNADVIVDADRDLFDLTDKELERLAVEKNDLLFCRTSLVREGVGRCALVGDLAAPTVFASNLIRARLDLSRADPRFWFYYFASPNGREQFQSIARGTSVTTITGPDISSLEVPDLELADQRRIAWVLGSLDDKIELNRRIVETLEQIAAAIFKARFVDFIGVEEFEESEIGPIPRGWSLESLGDHVDVTKGRSYKSEELAPSDTGLVTLKSFNRGGGYAPRGAKAYTGPFKPEQEVKTGEVVVAHTDLTQARDVIARPAIVRPTPPFSRLVASLDLAIVRPKERWFAPAFLNEILKTDRYLQHAFGYANGSTVLHLNKAAIPEFRLPMPPRAEVESYGATVGPMLSLRVRLEQESATLAAQRDVLLPKLISDELQVSDEFGPDGKSRHEPGLRGEDAATEATEAAA